QSGEFHGWPRLDDRGRGSPDHRRARRHRLAWLPFRGRRQSSAWRCAAPRLAFLFSTGRSRSFSSAMSGVSPIGLLLGWLLLVLAGNSGRAAAMLLPLYYLADSTITLLRRAANRETVWQAHRSHFYQRATDRGFRVIEVVVKVFG